MRVLLDLCVFYFYLSIYYFSEGHMLELGLPTVLFLLCVFVCVRMKFAVLFYYYYNFFFVYVRVRFPIFFSCICWDEVGHFIFIMYFLWYMLRWDLLSYFYYVCFGIC